MVAPRSPTKRPRNWSSLDWSMVIGILLGGPEMGHHQPCGAALAAGLRPHCKVAANSFGDRGRMSRRDRYERLPADWDRGAAVLYRPMAEQLVAAAPVSLRGRTVIDAGCGTGAATAA